MKKRYVGPRVLASCKLPCDLDPRGDPGEPFAAATVLISQAARVLGKRYEVRVTYGIDGRSQLDYRDRQTVTVPGAQA